VNEQCGFAALVGYASSQLSDVSNTGRNKPTDSSGLRETSDTLPRYLGMWRDHSQETV